MLVVASSVSLALGEHAAGLIIIAIGSVRLFFLTELQARRAVDELRKQTASPPGEETSGNIVSPSPLDSLRLSWKLCPSRAGHFNGSFHFFSPRDTVAGQLLKG